MAARPARVVLAGYAAAALVTGAAAAGVPPETATRLERAVAFLDQTFVGSCTLTVRAVVEKRNGKDRQESLRVLAFTRRADGTSETTLVEAMENGKDVTERERAKAARATPAPTRTPAEGANRKESGGKEASADLRLPTGDDARLYRFGEPLGEGDLLVVAYEPLRDRRGDEGMAKGRLAWHRDTRDPAWLEAELVALPTGVSRFAMRFEFARAGEVLYPRLTTRSGAGGVLWIRRNFEARVEISDLIPAPPAAPAAVP